MSAQFMVSIMGPERFGLLKQLAEKTHALGGRWLDSKTNHLGGQFSGLLKVEVPIENAPALKAELSELEGYLVNINEVANTDAGATLNVSYDANDRPGLVSDITHVLTDQGVQVEHMECHRVGVAELGTNIFTAQMKLRLPNDMEPAMVTAELESLDSDAVVNLN
ncbi:glycine cleavage system protein R [Corallincola platygyrae]|uniref:Glycine cleavage system transcriptional repressor n=1 Tax=Corallincola platygyrae TaxID=1193278 RepID=A0ABW4XJ38_9GAMM